jgi:hypothetical protein
MQWINKPHKINLILTILYIQGKNITKTVFKSLPRVKTHDAASTSKKSELLLDVKTHDAASTSKKSELLLDCIHMILHVPWKRLNNIMEDT